MALRARAMIRVWFPVARAPRVKYPWLLEQGLWLGSGSLWLGLPRVKYPWFLEQGLWLGFGSLRLGLPRAKYPWIAQVRWTCCHIYKQKLNS